MRGCLLLKQDNTTFLGGGVTIVSNATSKDTTSAVSAPALPKRAGLTTPVRSNEDDIKRIQNRSMEVEDEFDDLAMITDLNYCEDLDGMAVEAETTQEMACNLNTSCSKAVQSPSVELDNHVDLTGLKTNVVTPNKATAHGTDMVASTTESTSLRRTYLIDIDIHVGGTFLIKVPWYAVFGCAY